MGLTGGLGFLLDSHCLLWWDRDLQRLSPEQRSVINDRRNTIYVSAATAWELGIKQSKGKLIMVRSVPQMIERFAFLALPISIEHAERAAGLPKLHGDPFDRMLAAQALVESLTLVTVDPMMARYGASVLL